MSVHDPPPSYEVATGVAIQTTRTSQPTEVGTIPQQQQQPPTQQQNGANGQRCFSLGNTSEIKSMRYSKVGLAVLIFFCFCGALAIIVYFFAGGDNDDDHDDDD